VLVVIGGIQSGFSVDLARGGAFLWLATGLGALLIRFYRK
jgi:hypothetical protein